MIYLVCSVRGKILYSGDSWPMARSMLDAIVLRDERPQLMVLSEPEPEPEPESEVES